MPLCTMEVNPGRPARASYIPDGSPGSVDQPSAAVITVRLSPVSVFFSVTRTPRSTPPGFVGHDADTVANVICANAAGGIERHE